MVERSMMLSLRRGGYVLCVSLIAVGSSEGRGNRDTAAVECSGACVSQIVQQFSADWRSLDASYVTER